LAASATADRVRGLEAYYAFLDVSLGRWLAAFPSKGRQVVTVMQPGRVQQASAGLLAVSGTSAEIGEAGQAPPTSVAPTVLTALGVPAATDLAAPPVRTLFSAAFQSRYPARTIATYGERRASAHTRTGKPLDREMIERMRSLGYIR
jgi:hypothetical protein